jgi:mRNA interferase HigB
MNVIRMRSLREFWQINSGLNAEAALRAWYKVCRKSDWNSAADTRRTFRHSDPLKTASGRTATVFNVKGNEIRIIALIDYRRKRTRITHVLTHRQYDAGRWKEEI